jgi:lysine-N-methylase
LGNPVRSQEKELKKMAHAVVPSRVSELPPAAVHSRQSVAWPDFMRFIQVLDQTFEGSKTPIHEKILQALSWVGLVQQSRFDTIHGERLDEFLGIIRQASIDEARNQLQNLAEPGRVGRMLFRMLVAQYARKDTLVDRMSGLKGRWKLIRAATRFARGKGNVPPLQDSFVEVPFEQLEQPFGPLPAQAEKVFWSLVCRRAVQPGTHLSRDPLVGPLAGCRRWPR